MSEIPYTLRVSRRSRHLRVTVKPGGFVVVSAPPRVSSGSVERFVAAHRDWLHRAIARMGKLKTLPVSGRRDYLAHKEAARRDISARVALWAQRLSLSHGRISIKDMRRSWGSCSANGNLNFSYRVAFLPDELFEYVVVHELCHLREHNHSRAYWAHVHAALPDYRERRAALRAYVQH